MRDNRFDFYKAFLILGVVWGHIINHLIINDQVTITIHTIFRTYDMPFFMAISGYFLRQSCLKYSSKELLLNKVTTILLPSVVWSLLLSRFHSIDEYYFLTAVFASSVIVILLNTIVKNEHLRIALLFAISLLFYLVNLRLDNLSYLYPFFVMGYSFPKVWNFKKNPVIVPIIVITFLVCLCFWDKSYNIWNSGSYLITGGGKLFMVVLFRMIIAFVGILSVQWFLDVFYCFFIQNYGKVTSIIIEVGRESFSIYILHCFSFIFITKFASSIYGWLGFNIFTYNVNLLGYVIAPLLSVVIILLIIYLVRMMKRNRFIRAMLGFKIKDYVSLINQG